MVLISYITIISGENDEFNLIFYTFLLITELSEIRLQRRPSINIINNMAVGEVVAAAVPVRVALVPWTPCINITATIISQACPPPDPPTQSMGYSGSVPIITPTMPIMPPQTLAKIVAKGNVKVRNNEARFILLGGV